MKILLIGGSGTLGKELLKINPDIIAPTSTELNIIFESEYWPPHLKPDLVINCAAIIDNREIEKSPNIAVSTNIIGAGNVALYCMTHNIRYVYLSTDYVYPGDHGNYKESDPIQPFNLYAWTKLGGECSAKAVNNHLIIRTSFGKSDFDYKEAFTDKYSSKDYVDVIAPMIYEAAISPLTGTINIGTERKSLYAHASERSEVKPVRLSDTNFHTPVDTSLNLQKWLDYKQSNAIAKPHTNCRVCGSDDMVKYLDLGLMPLANNLEVTSQGAKNKERFPLQVMFCKECALSQLSVVIDPDKMFSYYTYRSSVNGGYVKHCQNMANELAFQYGLNGDTFHIDIAGNDGTLLNEFKKGLNHKVLNIDPATNLTAIAEANGIPSVAKFWSSDLAKEYAGQADLITATNVFAHLDDVKDFIKGCEIALKDDGVLVIENPYLIDFIEHMEFDTVYFEHVTYWSLMPMMRLVDMYSMRVIEAQKQDIHGGTMRYIIAKKTSKHETGYSLANTGLDEKHGGYGNYENYSKWSSQVKSLIDTFTKEVMVLKKSGKKISAFAASAKGNTLLNCAMMNTDVIDYIADDTPEKIGKFSPGTGIPIVNPQKLKDDQPDYVIILSWNFTDSIIDRCRAVGYLGKFIIAVPEFKVLD